jgi:hypothetical protein
MPALPLIDFLYRALNSPHGIVVETSDPERLRQKLYAERKKDPDLAVISINISRTQPESQLWLVKRK